MTGNEDRKSTLCGVILTVALHAVLVAFAPLSKLTYLYPPPQEESMVIEFSEDPLPQDPLTDKAPEAAEPDMQEEVKLVQKSESVYEAERENLTMQSKSDGFGDVPTPEPERKEEVLDPRASFPGMAKKDTSLTAAHTADKASDEFKAGQSAGNTARGNADGKPNAHVQGRNTVGNIPRPVYQVQESGIVVVDIWVDNYGNVKKAVPGGDGTTVMNKALLAAARNAAMETHFNMSKDAPAMQEGRITYYFNLK